MAPIYSAGQLTQRVTFREPIVREDELGQPVPDFADICTVWAKREGLGGLEAAAAGAQALVLRERFIVRARGDVNSRQRVVWRGAEYEIEGLQLLGDRLEWLEVICKAAQ